jgi:hypothetical protein
MLIYDPSREAAFWRADFNIPYERVRIEDLSIGKQKRVRGAPNRNNNGAFILNEVIQEME